MTYLARLSIRRLLLTALVPVLLLTFLTASPLLFHEQDSAEKHTNLERIEHKITQPVRIHKPQLPFASPLRLDHPENLLAFQPEASVPLLCVSLYPIIYILLKRLLLYPLKYTSHFVDGRGAGLASFRASTCTIRHRLSILALNVTSSSHEDPCNLLTIPNP